MQRLVLPAVLFAAPLAFPSALPAQDSKQKSGDAVPKIQWEQTQFSVPLAAKRT